MDFAFLFDRERKLLHIGYDAGAEPIDRPITICWRRRPVGRVLRHRQGRYSARSLVPPGAATHLVPRPPRAGVVVRAPCSNT